MKQIKLSIVLFLCFGLSTACLYSQDRPAGPSYKVDLSDAINHYVTVTMTSEAESDKTELMMATWTPGSYLVREYAKFIDRMEVTTTKGKPLEFVKTRKNRWEIQTRKNQKFEVTYRIFCKTISVRTNWAGHNYAVLNGAPTFLTVPDHLDRSHEVTLVMPDHWKKSATSLNPVGDEAHRYQAANFDELVDSPIVAGHLDVYPFKVAGVEHFLVNVNEMGYWDGAAAARDLKKVVEAHHEMWGSVPYDRYYFLNVLSGTGGGLEHDNCCLVMSSRWSYRNKQAYQRWLTLASHEFFHTWNVRRLRPKSLVKYDYESEVYTPSLWIAEGVTSYYEGLLLVRAGLVSKSAFISSLSGEIGQVQRTEGRKVQSLRDASHDAWIKFYRPESNSSSTTISYYVKGAVVAFLLDAEIRSATNGEKSLDDAMRKLYEEHANGIGYTPDDFRKICNEVAGKDLTKWFANAVDSTNELEYQTAVDWLGLKIGDLIPASSENEGDDDDKKDDETKDDEKKKEPKEKPWVGVGEPDSPASKAGLADTDEVIGVNDMRIGGGLESHINQFKVGDAIKVLVARDDKLQEILITIGSRPEAQSWSMSVYRNATEDEKEHLAKWLHLPFERKKKKEEAQPEENSVDEDVRDDDENDKEKQDEIKDDGQRLSLVSPFAFLV